MLYTASFSSLQVLFNAQRHIAVSLISLLPFFMANAAKSAFLASRSSTSFGHIHRLPEA